MLRAGDRRPPTHPPHLPRALHVDIHVPFTTVHEALQLSARLRLPSHIGQDHATREAFVQEVRGLGKEAHAAVWRGVGRVVGSKCGFGLALNANCAILCGPLPCTPPDHEPD